MATVSLSSPAQAALLLISRKPSRPAKWVSTFRSQVCQVISGLLVRQLFCVLCTASYEGLIADHVTFHLVPLPMFSFTGNKKSIAGGGTSTFYGKSGINFYTQTKTVTSLWREEDAGVEKGVNMPTQS